jgi:hypothetical protein
MHNTLNVSLAPGQKRHAPGKAPLPLLAENGASVILGAVSGMQNLNTSLAPSASSLFGPRGACVAADGSLWVADTGHHRMLGWHRLATEDNAPAQILIGQPDFAHEGRNAKGAANAATLNVPSGMAACGAGIAVADGWNHRVLIWHEPPRKHNQPADLVLGQADFGAVEGNRGRQQPGADTLFWPFGVAWDGARLWVADTGNRRVLMWNGLPARNGQPATLVLGQRDFASRDENAGGAPDARSMRWPHGLAFLGTRLCVADAGNNRVMIWHNSPTANGQACDAMLGQQTPSGVDHNQGDYWPTAAALNMPYALTTRGDWLVVADTASSRLLAWHDQDIKGYGAHPRLLAAQPDWEAKGDNRWMAATRDSLCWPFGLCSTREYAIVVDAGNNRVMLWHWSRELQA